MGYSILVDEDFDYRGRMGDILQQLAELNSEANELMGQILSAGSLNRHHDWQKSLDKEAFFDEVFSD